MEKKMLFAMICTCVVGFAISSCNSDDGDRVAVNPKDNPMYSEYIRDAKDESAIVHYESCLNAWYLLDASECRYYIYTFTDESNEQFNSLLEKGLITDGALVKFDGKVYGTTDEWRESTYNYLGHLGENYDMLKREYHSDDDNWVLPSQSDWLLNNSKDKAFVLMMPFTITKAE